MIPYSVYLYVQYSIYIFHSYCMILQKLKTTGRKTDQWPPSAGDDKGAITNGLRRIFAGDGSILHFDYGGSSTTE